MTLFLLFWKMIVNAVLEINDAVLENDCERCFGK